MSPLAAQDLVVTRSRLRRDPLAWFALQPADRPLVEVGQRVIAGDPLLERVRDPSISEARLPPTAETPAPGEQVRSGQPIAGRGRRAVRFPAGGRVLYEAPSRQLRVAVGTQHEVFASPVVGLVETVTPGGIGIRTTGLGLPGVASAGDAAAGRLVLAVASPDAELRASAVDVGGSGAILVAGSRVDVEALTRARAMGVRGVITGGLMGRDLRGFLASEARQRAALHPTAAFGAIVLDGYGRRPIPSGLWDCLLAAEGQEVGLIIDPPMVVLPTTVRLPVAHADRVRVTAGTHLNRDARFLGAVGPWRHAGGVYQSSALVELEDGSDDLAARVVVPLGDLERFE